MKYGNTGHVHKGTAWQTPLDKVDIMLKQIGADRKLYEFLAELVVAQSTQNDEGAPKSRDKANELAEHFLPHGSSFDAGTHVDW